MPTATFYPGSNADDGFINYDTGVFSTTEHRFRQPGDFTYDLAFINFANVAIPPGSTINSARFDLTADATSGGYFSEMVTTVDYDDAVSPTSYAEAKDLIDSHLVYAAYGDWYSSTTWNVDSTYSSSDLSTVVQYMVNRPGWVSGNHILLWILDSGSTPGIGRSYYGQASPPPALIVDWSTPVPPPPSIAALKNQLYTSSAWLLMLEVTLKDLTKFYLTNNNENINWGPSATEYTAIPFDLSITKTTLKGELPTTTLRISNITRALQPYIEASQGGVGATVKLDVINSASLTTDYSDLTMTFDVVASDSTAQWISLTLGAPNPLHRRFPMFRYIPSNCMWVSKFGNKECNYPYNAGNIPGFTSCGGTLADCENRGNATRFGGFVGLATIGIRVV